MENTRLLPLFDEVMRAEESQRGTNVPETCRLLAVIAKQHAEIAPYDRLISEFEELYLEQFIHTCMAVPDFAKQVHAMMNNYKINPLQ